MFSRKFHTIIAGLVLLLVSVCNSARADHGERNPGGPPPPPPMDCNPPARVCSEAGLLDGNLTLDYRLPFYKSLGVPRQLRFVYNSTTADVRPIIARDATINSFLGGSPATVSARLMVNGQAVSFPQGTEIFYDGGLTSGNSVRQALQFDANDLPTGLYSHAFSVSQNFANRSFSEADFDQTVVNNQRNSPFGAGWGLDGLQRLHLNSRSGLAVVTEGNGAAHVFSLRSPTETGLLNARREFLTPGRPILALVRDFNRDGHLDLAVISGFSEISILLGDGQGNFSNFRTLTVGTQHFSAAVGDFNGDGIDDLVIVHRSPGLSERISVLLGNGNGDFCQVPLNCPSPIDIGTPVPSITVGDFNGDGKADLAMVTQSPRSLLILLGNGDGTFQPRRTIDFSSTPESITVGDFNGDGHQDLAVATTTGFSILINRGDGTGNFQPRRDFAVASASSIAVGDFNGDGHQDLAISLNFDNSVLLALGDGLGNFNTNRARVNLGISQRPKAIAVADFNQDDNLDLAVANETSATVSILLGDGQGNLTAARNFSGGHRSPQSIAVGDFNEDGRLDLAATSTNGMVSVMLGDGIGNFAAGKYFDTILPATAIATGDFNHDGNPDLVFGHELSNKITILLGDGQGNLGAARQITVEGLVYVHALAIGDFNGDGKPDIAVGGRRTLGPREAVVTILLGNGDGSFQLAGTFPVGAPVLTSIAVGDFRGVGKQDLVFASWLTSIPILFGNGDGTFQPPQLIPVGTQFNIISIAIGDFRGNGKQDLVAIIASGALFILLGNGNGTFGTATPVPVGIQLRSVAVADVNEDGKQDLVAVTPFSPRRVVILIGNGDGTFQLPARFFPLLRPTNVTNEIKVADFNGDGHQDLAVLNDDSVSVLLGDGQGNFPTRLDYAGEPSPTDLAVGDFNSDGKSDLALATQAASKTVSLLLSFPSSSPGDYSRLTRCGPTRHLGLHMS